MNDPDPDALRVLQIVYAALLFGVLAFGALVLVLTAEGAIDLGETEDLRVVSWIAAASLAVLAPAAYVIREAVRRRGAGQGDAARFEAFRAGELLYAAVLEGCALLNLVAWLLVGDPVLNGVVALVAWALMAASFPTREKLEGLAR